MNRPRTCQRRRPQPHLPALPPSPPLSLSIRCPTASTARSPPSSSRSTLPCDEPTSEDAIRTRVLQAKRAVIQAWLDTMPGDTGISPAVSTDPSATTGPRRSGRRRKQGGSPPAKPPPSPPTKQPDAPNSRRRRRPRGPAHSRSDPTPVPPRSSYTAALMTPPDSNAGSSSILELDETLQQLSSVRLGGGASQISVATASTSRTAKSSATTAAGGGGRDTVRQRRQDMALKRPAIQFCSLLEYYEVVGNAGVPSDVEDVLRATVGPCVPAHALDEMPMFLRDGLKRGGDVMEPGTSSPLDEVPVSEVKDIIRRTGHLNQNSDDESAWTEAIKSLLSLAPAIDAHPSSASTSSTPAPAIMTIPAPTKTLSSSLLPSFPPTRIDLLHIWHAPPSSRVYSRLEAAAGPRGLNHPPNPFSDPSLRVHPILFGVEVKSPDGSLYEAELQLAGWAARMVEVYRSVLGLGVGGGEAAVGVQQPGAEKGMPPVWGIAVVGHHWNLYFAVPKSRYFRCDQVDTEDDEGDTSLLGLLPPDPTSAQKQRSVEALEENDSGDKPFDIRLVGPIPIGDTTSLQGAYRVLRVVGEVKGWCQRVWWDGYKNAVVKAAERRVAAGSAGNGNGR